MFKIQIQDFKNKKIWKDYNNIFFKTELEASEWIKKNNPNLYLKYNVRVEK